jgi:hypothetical protein
MVHEADYPYKSEENDAAHGNRAVFVIKIGVCHVANFLLVKLANQGDVLVQ